MENDEARKEIIHGISADADARAAAVVEEAKKARDERIKAAERQAERIKAEAEEKADRQVAAIENEAATRLSAAKRRLQLEMMEKIYQSVLSRCRAKLSELVGTEAYGGILENWITEAVVGLRAQSSVIDCSAPERETASAVLKRAETRAGEILGYPVSLSLADTPPPARQGVTVTAADGRTAFNNQVESRLFRFQTEIRKLVHDRLFARK
jgi:vacuolar-type H+-ATPase subunit E/Vma4